LQRRFLDEARKVLDAKAAPMAMVARRRRR
jgi:hypothetical protein